MTQKSKSLHSMTIEGVQIRTQLRYNLNTNYIGINTIYQYSKQYSKQYYKNNKDKVKEYQKNNKNKIKKYNKEYQKNNKNRISQRKKQYYKDNIDKKKKYYENNKEKRKQYYESHRNPNTLRMGSKEHKIMVSCIKQGINREDFDGFIINQSYCNLWTLKLREKIRNQYNNCDYISGIHKSICNNDRNLDVHHVNYDKQCGCNGNKCKLIPLSRSNHVKTNTNRSFWNKLFIYSLDIDKWYYGGN